MKKTYCDHCGKEAKDFSVQVEIRMGEAHVEYRLMMVQYRLSIRL